MASKAAFWSMIGPLVALNFPQGAMQHGQTPTDVYKAMLENVIEADGRHPAFERPALEQLPSNSAEKSEEN